MRTHFTADHRAVTKPSVGQSGIQSRGNNVTDNERRSKSANDGAVTQPIAGQSLALFQVVAGNYQIEMLEAHPDHEQP